MRKASRRKGQTRNRLHNTIRGYDNARDIRERLDLGEDVDYNLLNYNAAEVMRRGYPTGKRGTRPVGYPRAFSPKTGPEWAGSFSFNTAWSAAFTALTECPILGESEIDGEPRDVLSPSQMASLMALTALRAATPVYIGEEQLKALPPELDMPLVDVVRDPGLPFPATYLDFSSARGPAKIKMSALKDWPEEGVQAMYEKVTLLYHGALIFEAEPQTNGGEFRNGLPGEQLNAGLTIIPFCSTLMTPDGEKRVANRGDGGPMPEGAPIGALCFGRTPTEFSMVHGDFSHPMTDLATPSDAAGLALSVARVPLHYVIEGLPGYADVGEIQAMRKWIEYERRGEDPPEQFRAHFLGQTQMLVVLALEVFKALHLLNAANVTIEPMQLPRQQRRQAERKGGAISMTVRVTRTSKVPPKSAGEYRREYSHRFVRRGHYRHVTKGKHAKADFVKPCSRRDPKTGQLTCPDGCRREWVPLTVVGPEDRPYVPKTRVWPGVDKLMDEGDAA